MKKVTRADEVLELEFKDPIEEHIERIEEELPDIE